MYASPRRISLRDIELGVRPSRAVLSRRSVRAQQTRDIQCRAIERFVRQHKVGDVVSATVIRNKGNEGEVLLECGVLAHLDDCLDHLAGRKVEWLTVPEEGQRIQVYVRLIRPEQCRVWVSLHSFTRDSRFNLFNVGYRASFDGTVAVFALLPWDKPWLDRNGCRQ